MATVERKRFENNTVRIEMTADAAEALMTVMQNLTFEGNEAINDEFGSIWDGLVDLFAADRTFYDSARFGFEPNETLVYNRVD